MNTPTKHRPCDNCPWRKDAPVGYWHREHFENIAQTCYGDGMQTMGCHKGNGLICAGWAAVEGFDSIGLRLAAIRGAYDHKKLDVSGLELFPSMRAMIAANNKVYVAQGQNRVPLPQARRR